MVIYIQYKKDCLYCKNTFFKPKNVSLVDWFGSKRRPEGVKYCSRICSQNKQKGRKAHNKRIPGKKWNEERKIKCTQFFQEKRKNKTTFKKSGGFWSVTRKWVLQRDNFTCLKCGFKEPEIMKVDHIIPQAICPELRYNMDNCQTLCPNCEARKTIKDKKDIYQWKKKNLLLLSDNKILVNS